MRIENARYTLQSEPLLAGDDGTAQTIARIRGLVESGKKDPVVNRITGSILRGDRVPAYNDLAEVRAIFAWVVRNIRFTKDPEGKECLRPARTTLEWGFGDCDDINAILLPSMLGTIGYLCRVVTISSHPSAPDQFSHVYCEVRVGGRWIPLDAARKGTRFGTEPGHHFRKRVWSLVDDRFEDLRGLGCGSCGGNCSGCSMKQVRALGTHARLGSHLRLGRAYRSTLGDFDWGDFATVLDSAGKATTSIVAAARAPGGVVYPSMSVYPSPVPGVPPGGGVSAIGSVSSNTLVWAALGIGAVLLLSRRQ